MNAESLFVILSPLFDMAIYLIPILLLIGFVKSPFFKGWLGEFIVNLHLQRLPNDYHLIKDTTLPTEDGTTQIDHIVVSPFGIFVIETKNMKGWIYGSEKQRQWTQKIYKHNSKFQNPLHQNYKHMMTLASLLELPVENFFSIVIFIGDCELKTNMPQNVTTGRGALRYILSKNENVLNDENLKKVIGTIVEGRLSKSLKTHRSHVAHVKNIINEKNNKEKCHTCGADMLLREAKKGKNKGSKFWGCSRYPKCRTVKPL